MIKKSITKKYNINGPVNIIRLEKDSKIVYIFGHLYNEYETQCKYKDNIETIDIDKFFIKLFRKNPEQQYDFFYEFYSDEDPEMGPSSDYKGSYFDQIINFAFNNIKFEDNKIHISDYFPKVRFHYFNIQNSIPSFREFYNNENKLEKIDINLGMYYIFHILETILINLNELKNYLISNKNEYINKILDKYNNEEIKNQLNKLFNTYILDFLNEIIKLCIESIDYIDNRKLIINDDKDKNLYDKIDEYYKNRINIFINIKKIKLLMSIFFIYLSDLFLIRRLLDKKYINKCIIYTGIYNMVFISYILVKYFNFKITNIAKNSINDINELLIKSNFLKYDDFYFFYQYFSNDDFQCSNLFNFPDNLT